MILVKVETRMCDWVIAVKETGMHKYYAYLLFWLQAYKWPYGLCGIVHFIG